LFDETLCFVRLKDFDERLVGSQEYSAVLHAFAAYGWVHAGPMAATAACAFVSAAAAYTDKICG